jgi:hypothetical protein
MHNLNAAAIWIANKLHTATSRICGSASALYRTASGHCSLRNVV